MKPFQTKDKATGEPRYGGAWLIKYKAPDGKYRKQIGGATEKEAERTLRGIEVDIERGVWVDPRKEKRKKVEESTYRTFGDVCDAFTREYANRAEASRKSLRDTLALLHKGMRGGDPLLPGTTAIRELTPARVRHVRDAFAATDWATATKNTRLVYFKSILKWAWKHPSIPLTENLACGLEPFRDHGTRGGDGMIRTVSRDEVFSKTEAAKMVKHAFAKSDLLTAFMLQTAFLTGLRKGELAGLKWCDVDLTRHLILVCRNYDRRGTKSGHDRQVPAVPELLGALRRWKAKSPCSKDNDPVFPDADGGHRRNTYAWSQTVHDIAIGAGVARDGMRRWGHLTRHTFATQWLLAGGTDTILSKILGHVDTSLIHRVYAHFCDFDLVDAAAKIDLRLATKATKKETKKASPRVVSRRNGSKHENAIGQ